MLVIKIKRVERIEENLVLVNSKKNRRKEERLYFPKPKNREDILRYSVR